MSEQARRTEISVSLNGTDITADINKYLISLTYTDHEEDKADDLVIEIDDREQVWIQGWITKADKRASLSATITQKYFESGGVIDCGEFEIDTIDFSEPPTRVSMKSTSLPHMSTVRSETRTKAWELIRLSEIANEIAVKNGMTCMFESSYDPFYERREQIQLSDIVFLQGLCKDAGISLKATSKQLVLFDELDYESRGPVRNITRGESDVKTARFGTKTDDATYSKCHVSYTDPASGETIEYTYTPRDAPEGGQILEIREKVKTREEARQLAMKRLRQKNKGESSAEFTLVGDVALVAGVTVQVNGWGMFDGKYIIETATHSVTGSGHTVQLKLRLVLEGY